MEDEIEQHFLAAQAGFTLFGFPLASFSPSRKVAAQSMGMLYPFIGEAGKAQYEATGVYKGAIKDTIILLWLCHLKDRSDLTTEEARAGTWTPDLALARPEEAFNAALAWGTSTGILEYGSPEWEIAFATFCAIGTGMAASQFNLSLSEDSKSGEAGAADDPKV